MARVTVRLTDRMAAQLEAVASEHGVPGARFVRQLIAQAVAGQRVEGLGPPSEGELLDLQETLRALALMMETPVVGPKVHLLLP